MTIPAPSAPSATSTRSATSATSATIKADELTPAGRLEARFGRPFFGTGIAVSLSGALLYGLLPLALAPGMRALMVGACLVMVLLFFLLGWRHGAGVTLSRAMLWCSVAMLATIAVTAVGLGEGVHTLALAFIAPLLILVATLVSLRASFWLAAAGAALVGVLAGSEAAGLLAGAAAVPTHPLLLRVVTQWLLLATALSAGALLASTIQRSLAEARLRESRFRDLLAVAADWYWEMDAEFRFTHLAEQVPGGSGATPQERLGKTPWEIADFGIDPDALDAHRADLESHQAFNGLVSRRRGPDGQWRWLSVSGEPRFDARGRFTGYRGVGRDVSNELQAELATAATEARYRELFARTPSPLVLHRDGRVIDVNPAALALFGVDAAHELIGQPLLGFYDDSDGSRTRAARRAARLSTLPVGQSAPVQRFGLHTRGGRRVAVQANSVIVEAEGGNAILTIYEDETERLRADRARQRSEALLSHLVATSPDLITLTDLATGRYVMVNDAFVSVSGYTRQEVIGKTALELGVWPDAQERARFAQTLTEQGRVRDHAVGFVAKSGQAFSLMVSAARFAMEGRDYLVLNGRDVTRQEHERLEREAILENASIGIAMSRNRVLQLANPRFEQMFGWPPGTMVGQPGRVIWCSDQDYARIGRQYGAALARGEPVEIEHTVMRRDGSIFACRLMARAVDPSHPAKGGTIWIAEDVTERLAVEQALEQARDAAEAANRAKSAFLANTSHEIRTPLNGLVGLARMARQPGLDEARRAHYLRQIDDSAQALSGVISDILDLSKIEAGKLQIETVEFDLHALLESIERGYAALAEVRALTLRMQVAPAVPRRVVGDPLRLRQVLSNFLSNALKFTQQGSVQIAVQPAAQGGLLRFEVRDTGPGIDAATQARLFTPFTQADESTTRRYGGTGLGLSICRQLAQLMGGEVGVVSEVGHGSCFWAELPLPASTLDAPGAQHGGLEGVADPLTGLQVLIAEDNPVNMLIAVALLEQWGIEVDQAGDGAQAVQAVIARADAGRPLDLVLMDVQMPVQGGHEATRALRQRFDATQLPVVALTAAALTSERDEALAAGMNDFLTKPIDAQRLRDALLRWGRARSAA